MEIKEIRKLKNKIIKKLWDEIYKEEVEIDDCLEPLRIFSSRFDRELKKLSQSKGEKN